MTSENHERYPRLYSELFKRSAAGIKYSLGPTIEALEALGRPDHKLRSVVVVGTNGKGSTCAILAAGFQAMGLRVGLFSSPHLIRFNERISVNGKVINDAEVELYFNTIQTIESSISRALTFFEITTLMAVLHFREQGVDFAIFEAGLGGRLDSTNALQKTLTIITPVALDHQNILGDSLEAIATEKAAIMDEGIPHVLGQQKPGVRSVIETQARARQCPLIRGLPAEMRHTQKNGCSVQLDGHAFSPQLCAPYFVEAFSLAGGAAKALLGESLDMTTLCRGFARAKHPGRYDWRHVAGVDVILDGAHNQAGIQALASALDQDPKVKSFVLLCTALQKKSPKLLAPLQTRAETIVWAAMPDFHRGRSLAELQTELEAGAILYNSPESAFDIAIQIAKKLKIPLVVTGSLYFVGAIMEMLHEHVGDGLQERMPFS